MTSVLQILKSSHLANEKVHTVTPGVSVMEAARLMKEKGIGSLVVIYNGVVVGIITERDITFKVVASRIDPGSVVVAEYMTPDPICVTPGMETADCLELMKEKRIRHVPVMDKGKLIGLVSIRDLLDSALKDNVLLAQQLESYIIGNR